MTVCNSTQDPLPPVCLSQRELLSTMHKQCLHLHLTCSRSQPESKKPYMHTFIHVLFTVNQDQDTIFWNMNGSESLKTSFLSWFKMHIFQLLGFIHHFEKTNTDITSTTLKKVQSQYFQKEQQKEGEQSCLLGI